MASASFNLHAMTYRLKKAGCGNPQEDETYTSKAKELYVLVCKINVQTNAGETSGNATFAERTVANNR